MTQHTDPTTAPLAVVTGASRGLGRAIATGLATAGWRLVVAARNGSDLADAVATMPGDVITPVVGDITLATHRAALAEAAATLGKVDLLVNNAGTLGPSPLPKLLDLHPSALLDLLTTNVVAQLAVVQALVPNLASDATICMVTSDAARGAWPGWGGYGAAKAALDQLTAVLGVEQPQWHVHAVDPGDLRTDMHQAAFPDQDISDRPLPETVVPALLDLVARGAPSGRHHLVDMHGGPQSSEVAA